MSSHLPHCHFFFNYPSFPRGFKYLLLPYTNFLYTQILFLYIPSFPVNFSVSNFFHATTCLSQLLYLYSRSLVQRSLRPSYTASIAHMKQSISWFSYGWTKTSSARLESNNGSQSPTERKINKFSAGLGLELARHIYRHILVVTASKKYLAEFQKEEKVLLVWLEKM